MTNSRYVSTESILTWLRFYLCVHDSSLYFVTCSIVCVTFNAFLDNYMQLMISHVMDQPWPGASTIKSLLNNTRGRTDSNNQKHQYLIFKVILKPSNWFKGIHCVVSLVTFKILFYPIFIIYLYSVASCSYLDSWKIKSSH